MAEAVEKCREIGVGRIATVMGRYYAMDRDKRWDRVELAYDAMVYGRGIQNSDPVDAVAKSYANNVTDEFTWAYFSVSAMRSWVIPRELRYSPRPLATRRRGKIPAWAAWWTPPGPWAASP